ncbi:blue copper protein [Brachypodium distachyon]|nr:blue copper protein [Brachypodium distachyon]|eukprot:XP_003564105.3 blue copper protein [Brachypodium distachyon]
MQKMKGTINAPHWCRTGSFKQRKAQAKGYILKFVSCALPFGISLLPSHFAGVQRSRGCVKEMRGSRRGMAMVVLALALAGMAATSSAAVYKVGDTAGWTILGNINYADWASKQTFHVGDIIEFKYPQGIHNVLEVKKADYESCSNSTPIATHTSGDDRVAIRGPGHRFFICGVPGHCAAGQKLNVRVLKTTRSGSAAGPNKAPAAAPSAASPPRGGETPAASTPPAAATDGGSSSSTTTAAPAPNANGAAGGGVGWYLAVVAAASMAMLQ